MKNLISFIQENLHGSLNKDDLDYIQNVLLDSGHHSGFYKGCQIYKIKTDDLEDRIKKFYYSDAEKIPEDFYEIIKKNASENVLAIFGNGRDRTWAVVIFISTNPYTFIISKDGHRISELYKIKDEKEVTNEILDFCG